MELNANRILDVLREKGVDALYHANTVQTSCTFLQQGHLLSRGTIEERGLAQTPQQSDRLDKKYGLWYDVFLDGVDIHGRAKNRNLYGPILFVFDINLLSQDWLSSLWITKKNPQKWREREVLSDRYFSTVKEFQEIYLKGNFDTILVLRHIGGVLRLKPYLKKIVVDNPQLQPGEVDIYSQTVGALKASARIGEMPNIIIEPRGCGNLCSCASEYENMKGKTVNHLYAP